MNRSRGPLCAIHQPNLFPRPSTLAKLFAADIWIALDDVQFARRDYQHRVRLGRRDDSNAQQWMTIPVRSPNGRCSLIKDIRILERERSVRRILRLTRQHHGRARHWSAIDASIGRVAVEEPDRTEVELLSHQRALARSAGEPRAKRNARRNAGHCPIGLLRPQV